MPGGLDILIGEGIQLPSGKTGSMPRQRTHHSRITYVFPDDFPQRLKRFKEESGLSWAELNRRLGTYPYTVWRWTEGGVRPNAQHMMALLDLANSLGPRPPVYRLRRRFDRRRCLKRKKCRTHRRAGKTPNPGVLLPCCGLAPRADRLRRPVLLQIQRPLEHREGGGLRLAAAALGFECFSALNSAQESIVRCGIGNVCL